VDLCLIVLTSVETSLKSQLSCKPGRDGAEDLSNADGASTQSAEEGRFHGSAAEDEFLERDIDDRCAIMSTSLTVTNDSILNVSK
jgi:hypothetical protein